LIQEGANVLVGADRNNIVAQAQRHLNRRVQDTKALYGGGRASQAVVEALVAN
jgi:UDP-N-acetylglucosamine 2-epimerase